MSNDNLANKSLEILPEIALCQSAVKLQPNCAANYLNLAKSLAAQGKILAAIRASHQAVMIDPYVLEAYFNLGQFFKQTEEFHQAIAAYLEVLGIQPDYLAAYSQLAQVLRQIGRWQDAFLCDRYYLSIDFVNKFYPNPRPWSMLSDSYDCREEVSGWQIYPPTTIQLSPPKNLEYRICEQFKITSFEYLPAEVALSQNGRAWADYYTVAFLTARNQLISGYSCGSSPIIAASQKLPSPLKISGTVAFLSVGWGTTYFHWMTDLLPRIELLRLKGINFAKIDKFVVNRCQLPYEKATLNHFGIPEDKIIESQQHPHVEAERLVIAYLHYRGGNWVGKFLRQEFLTKSLSQVKSSGYDRLYISRKYAQYRKVINEAELVNCLKANFGFHVVTLETLSFAEQVAMMFGAKVAIAPHGAGLTNLVFCNPGTKIIEIFSPDYINNCYWLLSHQVNIDYYYLLGELLAETNLGDESQNYDESEAAKPNQDPDILVNLDKLVKLLEFAQVSPI